MFSSKALEIQVLQIQKQVTKPAASFIGWKKGQGNTADVELHFQ